MFRILFVQSKLIEKYHLVKFILIVLFNKKILGYIFSKRVNVL